MSRACTVSLALALLLTSPVSASAQSLADVAREEAARREHVEAPSKVYTNEDLRAVSGGGDREVPTDDPTAVSPLDSLEAADADRDADADADADDDGENAAQREPGLRDQAYWQERMTAARATLDRNSVLQAAVQSRINALNADFVNTDDPAQRGLVDQDRNRTLAELGRLEEEAQQARERIADIEDEARRAGVPPGWLR